MVLKYYDSPSNERKVFEHNFIGLLPKIIKDADIKCVPYYDRF